MDEQRKMKSIWFLVGLTLFIMGVLVLIADIGPISKVFDKIEKKLYANKLKKNEIRLREMICQAKKSATAAMEVMEMVNDLDERRVEEFAPKLMAKIDGAKRSVDAVQKIMAIKNDQHRLKKILEKYETNKKSILSRLRPNLWWGGFMIIFGLVFLIFGGRVKD